MLAKALPIMIVLPHAGQRIPEEVRSYCSLAPELLFHPLSTAVRQVFDVAYRVQHWYIPEISSQVVNVDTPMDDALPEQTREGDLLYSSPLPKTLKQELLAKYYQDFHKRLAFTRGQGQVHMGFACYVWPEEAGEKQLPTTPLFSVCLANQGDCLGEPVVGNGPVTCPPQWLRDFRDVLAARLADLPGPVLLNTPMKGNYLIQTQSHKHFPWIGIYVSSQLVFTPLGTVSSRRMENLRERLESVWVYWCSMQNWLKQE